MALAVLQYDHNRARRTVSVFFTNVALLISKLTKVRAPTPATSLNRLTLSLSSPPPPRFAHLAPQGTLMLYAVCLDKQVPLPPPAAARRRPPPPAAARCRPPPPASTPRRAGHVVVVWIFQVQHQS